MLAIDKYDAIDPKVNTHLTFADEFTNSRWVQHKIHVKTLSKITP